VRAFSAWKSHPLPNLSRLLKSPALQTDSKYLPQIDVIRAVAVFLVVLFHVSPTIFPSGFLGVDIFFVISGFVIAKAHFSNSSDQTSYGFTASIVFIMRRFYRLFPALFAYALIISLLFHLFDDTANIRGAMASALIGISNIFFFIRGQDYFSDDLLFNPYLQTWSLGVEQQYYIVVAIVIAISAFVSDKNRLSFFHIVTYIFTGLSFIYWLTSNPSSTDLNYFLPQYRAWEIGLGYISFFLAQRFSMTSIRIPEISNALVNVLILSIFMPRSFIAFAQPILCILTAFLLFAIQLNPTRSIFCNHRVLLLFGQSSYSIYLWHWGLFVIASLILPHGLLFSIAVISLSILIGIASFLFIEIPFRRIPKRLNLSHQIFIALPVTFLAILSPMLYGKYLYLGENSTIRSLRINDLDGIPDTSISLSNCFDFTDINTAIDRCSSSRYGNRHRLWVVGDSHAYRLMHMSAAIARRRSLSLTLLSQGGTPFPPAGVLLLDNPNASRSNDSFQLLERYIEMNARSGDYILLSNRLPFYFGSLSYENDAKRFRFYDLHSRKSISRSLAFRDWTIRLKHFADLMKQKGVKVIVVGPTPEWPLALNRQCAGQSQEWFNRYRGKPCKIPTADVSGDGSLYAEIQNSLHDLSRQGLIHFYDPLDTLCSDDFCNYSILYDGLIVPLYSDDDHLSVFATRELLRPAIAPFFE